MAHQGWTRDQLLAALSLYCQTPFGKMHSRNPDVIALASRIDRTPSAVALKLVNFASLDPELQGRGIGGMANTSAADREIWTEYYERWDDLAQALPLESDDHISEDTTDPEPPAPIADQTEILRTVRQRIGQRFFRSAVLAAYGDRCCITGITHPSLLRASHIIPWSHEARFRLDPRNGLCLNALHDAAFDRGLITITTEHRLLVSRRLKDQVPPPVFSVMFDATQGTQVAMPERFRPLCDALEYHRASVFQE